MMTAAPANPVCLIRFGREGVPLSASILKSSGDQRVDDAILASLYRWRAEGRQLEELRGDETIDVEMRLLLNRRRST